MKAKRVLAALLCAVMIFSTDGFTLGVSAAATASETDIELVGEEQEDVTEEETLGPTESPEATGTPEATKTPEAIEPPGSNRDSKGHRNTGDDS